MTHNKCQTAQEKGYKINSISISAETQRWPEHLLSVLVVMFSFPLHRLCYTNGKPFKRLKYYSLFSSKEASNHQCILKLFLCWTQWKTQEEKQRKEIRRPDGQLTDIPIVHCSSRIITCFHCYHEQREDKEKHRHGKADSVDSSVSNKYITADKAIQMWDPSMKPFITKSRYLSKRVKTNVAVNSLLYLQLHSSSIQTATVPSQLSSGKPVNERPSAQSACKDLTAIFLSPGHQYKHSKHSERLR